MSATHPRAPSLSDGTGATRALAEFAATLTLDEIPPEVRDQAQRIVIDTLGSSGAELIRAVVAAYEVSARLTLSLTAVALVKGTWPEVELVFNDVFGMGFSVFGATAGCCNLLGLPGATIANAFGLAGYGAPVPSLSKYASISVDAPNMNKYAAYGQIGFTSVLSSLLAAEGFTGDETVLDGPRGFWRMAGSKESRWDVLTGGLRERWWSLVTSFKQYPTCTWNRTPVEAMPELIALHDFQPEEIRAIDVGLQPAAAGTPFDAQPSSELHTYNSCPYAIAMAVLRIPGPLWQRQQTVDRADVKELMAKVTMAADPDAQQAFHEQIGTGVQRLRRTPATVTVHARGDTFTAHAEYAKGDPFSAASRMTDDELRSKLTEYGAPVLGARRLERAAELLFSLEQLEDISDLARALSLSPPA